MSEDIPSYHESEKAKAPDDKQPPPIPEAFAAWLRAFIRTSNLAGIDDSTEAWTWPAPPSDPNFFRGYPRLTTGDLRELHAALSAHREKQGGES